MCGRFLNSFFGETWISSEDFEGVVNRIFELADLTKGYLQWTNSVFKDIVLWFLGFFVLIFTPGVYWRRSWQFRCSHESVATRFGA